LENYFLPAPSDAVNGHCHFPPPVPLWPSTPLGHCISSNGVTADGSISVGIGSGNTGGS